MMNDGDDDDAGYQVKPQDYDTHRDPERGNKMVSEVYLTRLLTTKVAAVWILSHR